MVYSEIARLQMIEDALTLLLRTVNVTGIGGEVVYVKYGRPNYLPVTRKSFDFTILRRGYRFGGLFRYFFLAAVFLVKLGAKAVRKQLFNSGVNIINNITLGENIKLAAKWRLKEAGESLTDKTATKLKTMVGIGHPRKKRRLSNKTVIHRKTENVKTLNIFG